MFGQLQSAAVQTTRILCRKEVQVLVAGQGSRSPRSLLRWLAHPLSLKPPAFEGMRPHGAWHTFSAANFQDIFRDIVAVTLASCNAERVAKVQAKCRMCNTSHLVRKKVVKCVTLRLARRRFCTPQVSLRPKVLYRNPRLRLHAARYSFVSAAVESRTEQAETAPGSTGGTMSCKEGTSSTSIPPMRLFI